jgi:hypothetical protein
MQWLKGKVKTHKCYAYMVMKIKIILDKMFKNIKNSQMPQWVHWMLVYFNLNNIYLENNQNIQYIKHSKYRQDSETSNYCFYKSVS